MCVDPSTTGQCHRRLGRASRECAVQWQCLDCRRERSGDILRLKSLQMHREQQVQMQQLQQTTRASQGWRSDSLQGSPRAVLPSPGTAPIPVVSMELVSSLEAYFPAGSPVVHLLKAPAAFPAAEAAHLGGRGHFEEGSEVVGVRPCGC